MNINEAFPSKYMKASDVDGQPTVIIDNVTEEEVGRDKELRPVMYFQGEEKGIILNKTNATNIAKLYGPETDTWSGKSVQLGTTWVDFQGQSVEAIRIYPPKRQSSQRPLEQRSSAPQQQRSNEDTAGPRDFAPLEDSEIPF